MSALPDVLQLTSALPDVLHLLHCLMYCSYTTTLLVVLQLHECTADLTVATKLKDESERVTIECKSNLYLWPDAARCVKTHSSYLPTRQTVQLNAWSYPNVCTYFTKNACCDGLNKAMRVLFAVRTC